MSTWILVIWLHGGIPTPLDVYPTLLACETAKDFWKGVYELPMPDVRGREGQCVPSGEEVGQ